MDFTIKPLKDKNSKQPGANKTVAVPKKTLIEVINLLSQVECTCVWSEIDNQYLKVNDIPKNVVDELRMLLKLAK